MVKCLRALSLITYILFFSVHALTARAEDWPPRETGEGKLTAPVTLSLAERLRGLPSFAALQEAIGAKGRLEGIEDHSDGEPRALYLWTGPGGKGTIRVYRYRSGSFGATVTLPSAESDIRFNSFGAFMCTACSPPVYACGSRPSWIPHDVHWDNFDCPRTVTGPAKLISSGG
jgi:hypothetical protein